MPHSSWRRLLPRPSLTLTLSCFSLPIVVFLGLAFGVTDVPKDWFSGTFRAIGEGLRSIGGEELSSAPRKAYDWERFVVWELRAPRVLLLLLAGAALSSAGAALQATFHNPMASPSLIGVNSGGAFGAVLAISLGWSQDLLFVVPAMAFVFALLAGVLVYSLAYLGGRPSTTSLLLTGVAVGALMGALTSWMQTRTEFFRLQEIVFWMVGGARDRDWNYVVFACPFVAIGLFGIWFWQRRMDALSLGDDHALSVGVPVHQTRLGLLILSSLMAAAAVSACGPIAFVGLMVPHGVRFLVGHSARRLVPGCALLGGQFLILCDLIARTVSGETVVPLGVLTALLGVPFFLVLLIRVKRLG